MVVFYKIKQNGLEESENEKSSNMLTHIHPGCG